MSASVSSSIKKKCVRKYRETFLQYGFVESQRGNELCPQCIMCSCIFSNESMKPSRLKLHLSIKHPEFASKDIGFFRQLAASNPVKTIIEDDENYLLKASYLLSLRIGKMKGAFSLGETLIKPSIIDACASVFGDEAEITKKIRQLPLSRSIISRQLNDMSADIECQLIDRLKSSQLFALQIDNSPNATNATVIVGFVRYVHDGKILEDMLGMWYLPKRTTGLEIFEVIDNYFSKNDLNWKWVIGFCSDGSPTMTDVDCGVAAKVRHVAHENVTIFHSTSHQDASKSNKHLQSVPKKDTQDGFLWVTDPLLQHDDSFNRSSLSPQEEDLLVEISCDISLQDIFKKVTIDVFWCNLLEHNKFKILAEKAIRKLLPFSSTQLCTKAFSGMADIKNETKNHTDLQAPMRVATSSILPRIDLLIAKERLNDEKISIETMDSNDDTDSKLGTSN